MVILNFYVFFPKLPSLLIANEFEPSFLKKKEYFNILTTYPFILWEPIQCKNIMIYASKKTPLFGTLLSYKIGQTSSFKDDSRDKLRAEKIKEEFISQSFFENAYLCNYNDINDKSIIEPKDGSKRLKGAQYFIGITSMVKYCYKFNILKKSQLTIKERNLINFRLKSKEIFSEENLKYLDAD